MPQFILAETKNCGALAGGLFFFFSPAGTLRRRHGARPAPPRKTISRDLLRHLGGEDG